MAAAYCDEGEEKKRKEAEEDGGERAGDIVGDVAGDEGGREEAFEAVVVGLAVEGGFGDAAVEEIVGGVPDGGLVFVGVAEEELAADGKAVPGEGGGDAGEKKGFGGVSGEPRTEAGGARLHDSGGRGGSNGDVSHRWAIRYAFVMAPRRARPVQPLPSSRNCITDSWRGWASVYLRRGDL